MSAIFGYPTPIRQRLSVRFSMTSNAELETAALVAGPDQVPVLLVEDDDGDALLVEELLREGEGAVGVERARSRAHPGQEPGVRRGLRTARSGPAGFTGPERVAAAAGTGARGRHRGADRGGERVPRRASGAGRGAGLPGQGRSRRAHAEPGDPVRGRAPPGRGSPAGSASRTGAGPGERPARARPAAPPAAGRRTAQRGGPLPGGRAAAPARR